MTGAIVFVSPYLRVSTWRSLWPARELARRGFKTHVIGYDGERDYLPTKDDALIIHATNQDVGLSGTVRHFTGRGPTPGPRLCRKVAVQFDDDYSTLGNVQELGDWHAELMRDIQIGCRESDLVIAATPQVAEGLRFWTPGRGAEGTRVVRNWLPRWVTEIPVKRTEPPMAGWFGTIAAHRRDLEWLGPEAKRISRFGVVGDWEAAAEVFGRPLDWHTGIVWTAEHLYPLLGRFSVGIAPLVDDAFNRAKSWIKPLEFGALGIPCVASNVEPYRQLKDDGYPVALMDDPFSMAGLAELWLEIGDSQQEERRALVRDRYTLEARGGDEWQAVAEELLS